MSSLREMAERMNGWQNERGSGGGSNKLFTRKGDLIIFQFVASGEDADQFIKTYRAHVFEFGTKRDPQYCPRHSKEGDVCPLCDQGHTDIKERMSMWLYIHNIYHAEFNNDRPFPQISFQNRVYFDEEVKGFRIWHTSAWRESPWGDILYLYDMYKGLHNFTAQLSVVGDGTARRFKLYAIPNSPALEEGIYRQAQRDCTPITQILAEQVGSAVVAQPPAEPPKESQWDAFLTRRHTTPLPDTATALGLPIAPEEPSEDHLPSKRIL